MWSFGKTFTLGAESQHVLNFHLANFFLQKVHPHLFVIGIGLVPFPGILYVLDGIATGLETNSVRNQSRKVPKKSRNWSQRKLGTKKKSLGICLGQIFVSRHTLA